MHNERGEGGTSRLHRIVLVDGLASEAKILARATEEVVIPISNLYHQRGTLVPASTSRRMIAAKRRCNVPVKAIGITRNDMLSEWRGRCRADGEKEDKT